MGFGLVAGGCEVVGVLENALMEVFRAALATCLTRVRISPGLPLLKHESYFARYAGFLIARTIFNE